MKSSRIKDGPLSDAELDQLEQHLRALGPDAMNSESLDGYFAALHCSPVMLMPNEYLQPVFGEEAAFTDDEHAGKVMSLVMRHWNTVGSHLQKSLKRKDIHLPLLFEDADGVAHANDWAHGFWRGVTMTPGVWDEIIDDDEKVGMILPVMTLIHEHDPDPKLRPDPISPERRDKIIMSMAAGLVAMYEHFEPQRRANAAQAAGTRQYRAAPKVGRNDPCPCGSGQKFKRCCGGPQSGVH